MTYLYLTLITQPALLAGFLWFLTQQRAAVEQERDDHHKALLLLVEHADQQRALILEHARRERDFIVRESFRQQQALLERIQRPEQIPAQSAPDPSPEALFVPQDDDKAFWETRGVNADAG